MTNVKTLWINQLRSLRPKLFLLIKWIICFEGSFFIKIKVCWYSISGGSRIFPRVGGANSQSGCSNLLFCNFFVENCMKMKEFGSRGVISLVPPLNPSMFIDSLLKLPRVCIWTPNASGRVSHIPPPQKVHETYTREHFVTTRVCG